MTQQENDASSLLRSRDYLLNGADGVEQRGRAPGRSGRACLSITRIELSSRGSERLLAAQFAE
jgi:hypothetical protein